MQTPIVIDNESGYIRAGLSSGDAPTVVFRTDSITGQSPIQRNIVTDWEGMKQVWSHTFKQLGVDPSNYPVLVSEPPLNPKENREQTIRTLFETFNVPAAFVARDAVLALYNSGRTSGTVVVIDTDISYSVPISEGNILPHAVHYYYGCGVDLNKYLVKLLAEKGYNLSATADCDDLNEIRENLCYAPLNFENEMRSGVPDGTFKTSTGKSITLSSQRIMLPQALFDASLMNKESIINDLCFQTIMKCDVDIRPVLSGNMVLVGSAAKLKGLAARLEKEVADLVPVFHEVSVVESPDPKNAVWKGGDKLAPILNENSMWITKDEYARSGASIVHSKCF